MSDPQPRTNLLYYVAALIVAAGIVLFVFLRNYRAGEEAAQNAPPPTEKSTGGAAPTVNEQALAKDVSLAAKGKSLYDINCSSCHGPQGNGDGPRAASLVPKPRNFHAEQFKFGNDIVSIHNTIMKGSPGTSMPSFSLLPLEDTWAIAHFVYTQIPNPPPITDQQVASLPGGPGGGAATSQPAPAGSTATAPAGGGAPSSQQKPAAGTPAPAPAEVPRIPIEIAMKQIAEPFSGVVPPQPPIESSLPGAAIYAEHCAGCHGSRGEGKVQRVLSVAPYHYEISGDLTSPASPWLKDRNKFSQIVVKGLPGRIMPGQATLTSSQIDELYAFVQSLAKTP